MRCNRLGTALLLLLFAAIANAQDTTGSLEGYVFDRDATPLAGARVTIVDLDFQQSRSITTSADGRFFLPALPVGTYTVEISSEGYRTTRVNDVLVRLGRTTGLDAVYLDDATYQVEDMVVTASPPLIDPAATSTGYNVSELEFANLPFDRDYYQMLAFMPYANQSFYGLDISTAVDFGGATHLENRYFIDGVETTEPFWGEWGMALPPNFVQEVQVRAGAYQAEYRSSLGGVVDVITPRGSNEFAGEAFGFYSDNRTTGDRRLAVGEDPPAGEFRNFDIGAGVGGALKRDKLWYHIGFNPKFADEDIEIPTLGIYPDQTRSYRFAGKVTWRLNDQNDLFLAVVGSPSHRTAVWTFAETWAPIPSQILNPDMYLLDINDKNYVATLRGVHWLGENTLVETSASFHSEVYEEIPSTAVGLNEPFFVDVENGIWSGGVGGSLRNDYDTVDVSAKASLLYGKHTWKTGLQYRDRFGTQDWWGPGNLFRFVDPGTGEETYYADSWNSSLGSGPHNRVYSVFAQDSWRPRADLGVNVGVRWDGQRMTGTDGNVGLSIMDQWQPRVGVTFQPGERGSRKFFGNVGRFYQELGSTLAEKFREGGSGQTTVYDHDPRIDPSGGEVVFAGTGAIHERIEGIDGQYYDEVNLGVEQAVGRRAKLVVRGTYRTLRKGVENVFKADTLEVIGNPGYGEIAEFPKLKRNYTALELTYQMLPAARTGLLVSYIYSRNEGNYTGLLSSDYGSPYPNLTETFDFLATTVNSDGLLPNDRTHVLKLSGWYRTRFGLTAGATGWWMSGTPLSELGSAGITRIHLAFLSERGSAGRTPSIWDLNLRFAYDLPLGSGTLRPRFILDLLHVGSPRRPVILDQQRYFAVDDLGNPTEPNPNYGAVRQYQPPMAVRLGMRVAF